MRGAEGAGRESGRSPAEKREELLHENHHTRRDFEYVGLAGFLPNWLRDVITIL
jgi:hypothetical protein